MKKIPTIFKRDPENIKFITNEINPICQWVFDGEGIATIKIDGTCCKIENGKFFKRREVKSSKKIPVDFIEEEIDLNTGKRFGWVSVDFNDPQDKYHIEAFTGKEPDGTYELIGPKIQGNPERVDRHILISHDETGVIKDCPRTLRGIQAYFMDNDIEGIVFHHKDGRMGKIKKRDFGLVRR